MNLNNKCILADSLNTVKRIMSFCRKNGVDLSHFNKVEFPIPGHPDAKYYCITNNKLHVTTLRGVEVHNLQLITLPPEESTQCMVHIIKNSEGKPIGWEMCPETDEEHEIVATIRELQFFGMDETYPSYNGLELIDPNKGKCTGNIKKISWLMRKYQNK